MSETWSFRDAMRKHRPREDANGVEPAPIDPERAGPYAAAAVARECHAVATAVEGTRNDTLNRAGFSLAQLVAAQYIDERTVHDALVHAARTCGLDDREIDATLRSSLRAGVQHPRIVQQLPPVPDVSALNGVEHVAVPSGEAADRGEHDDAESSVRERFPIIDWHELWKSEDQEDWIVEPLLPARRLIALFSAPKVGKSLLMLEIAVAISRGEIVLGVIPDRPRRVLYVDFENDPRGDVRERLQAMGYAPDDLGDLCYLSFPRLAKLDTAFGGIDLMSAVLEYRCEVVVIDTISRAVAGEENDNDTWISFYRHTGMALKAAGVSCIRLDHSGKDVERGMRGGSAKYGDVDAVWRLSAVTDETLRLDCTDHRLPIAEKTLVVRRKMTPSLHHEVQAEGRAAARRAQVEQIIRALDELNAPVDIGRDGAKELLSGTGVRARNETYSEAVRQRKIRHNVFEIGDGA